MLAVVNAHELRAVTLTRSRLARSTVPATMLLLSLAAPLTAGTVDVRYGWTNTIGTSRGTVNDPVVTTDSAQNVLLLGSYYDETDFDPGAGVDLHPGSTDCQFLSKYAPDGSYLWTRSWQFDSYSNPFGVVTDSLDNVIITGGFSGLQDLDPGPGEQWHDAGDSGLSSDIFIIKLDGAGNLLWTQSVGGDEFCHGLAIAVDAGDNIYVTGQFCGSVDFDASDDHQDIHESHGGNDTFLTSVEASGLYRWTYVIGGPGYEFGSGITVDNEANIFVTGGAHAGTDFDPTGGIDLQPITGDAWDIYLTRINADRTYAWTRTFGGTDYDQAQALAINDLGAVAVAGVFQSVDADFDPGDAVDLHSTRGRDDAFVTVFTSDGVYEWTRTLGGDERDYCEAVAIDSFGSVFLGAGIAENSDPLEPVDLDPTDGEYLYWPSDMDGVVTKLQSDGTYDWSATWSGVSFDDVNALAVDSCDNLLLAGRFSWGSPVDFDPTDGEDWREAIGGLDVFASKLYPCGSGDVDGDGRIDLSDAEAMYSCLTGPDQPASGDCCVFDLADDKDVDLADFGEFQRLFPR